MSLFGTLNQSANALRVNQIGLQVVANNISNANTPGYIRQELVTAPASTTRIGNLLYGNGVEAIGIVQRVDYALANRLRDAASQLEGGKRLESAYSDLEQVLGSLTDGDFGETLSTFNNTLHDLYNRPQDASQRQLVVLQGAHVADQVRELYNKARDGWNQANQEVGNVDIDINRLTRKIADLNLRIVDVEGGRTVGSDATGLRDERLKTLNELGQLVNITVQEQSTGGVNVFVGGDYLVADGYSRDVVTEVRDADLENGFQLRIKESGAVLDLSEGRIGGAVKARDEVYGVFMHKLDGLAGQLAQVFNELHTQGQGTEGFTDLTSSVRLNDVAAPLSNAGLDFTPRDGTFEIQLYDGDRKLLKTQRINVAVKGPGGPMGIEDVADQISAIDGLEAEVTDDGGLRIKTENAGTEFAFGKDTSGFLAAMGINTFFIGNSALTLDVNPILQDNANLLATSKGGIGQDNANLEALVDGLERTNTLMGTSVHQGFDALSTQVTQSVSIQRAASSGLQTYHSTLESDFLSYSGVSIDEEAIKMIGYQRAFQASAKVISVTSELLDSLVNL